METGKTANTIILSTPQNTLYLINPFPFQYSLQLSLFLYLKINILFFFSTRFTCHKWSPLLSLSRILRGGCWFNSNSSGGIDKEGEHELGGNGEPRWPNSMSVGAGTEFMTRWKTKKKCAQQGLTRSRKGLTRSRRREKENKKKKKNDEKYKKKQRRKSSGRIAPN